MPYRNPMNETDLSDEISEMFSEYSSDEHDPAQKRFIQAFNSLDSEVKKPVGYLTEFAHSKTRAVLNKHSVSEIKLALNGGIALRQLAFKYAVTQSTIHQTKTGATWKEVKPQTKEQIHNSKFFSDGSSKLACRLF